MEFASKAKIVSMKVNNKFAMTATAKLKFIRNGTDGV
jgi:hypothetical protein